MKTEDPARGGIEAPAEKHVRSRASVLSSLFVPICVTSLVLVLLSYWFDVVPDNLHEALGFIGWRFAFVILSVSLITFAIERDRAARSLARQLEDERSTSARLTDTDRVRGDLVATVTHELKTPLTSLLGYTSILRKRASDLTEEQRVKFLATIEEQGKRVLHLTEELLQSSRMEGGGKLQRAPVDIGSILRDAADELSTGRGRLIDVSAPVEDLGLFGDPAAVEHVVTNLLENALKYSDGVVHAMVEERGADVVLVVRDEGAGIEEDELPFIFDRFRQSTNARGAGSVGLGLYIVKNLVEAHGGAVSVESKPGKGSVFTVAFPRRRAR